MGAQREVVSRLRVVHDTNVAVSALLFRAGQLGWLREAWTAARVVPLISQASVAELMRVLTYPKFALGADEAKGLLAHYLEHAEVVSPVKPRGRVPSCRDPDDQKFIALAWAAGADALVTGDADLLVLAPGARIPILRPAALRERLAQRAEDA